MFLHNWIPYRYFIGNEFQVPLPIEYDGNSFLSVRVEQIPFYRSRVLPTDTGEAKWIFLHIGSRLYGLSSSVDLPASSTAGCLQGAVSPKGNFIVLGRKEWEQTHFIRSFVSRKNYEISVQGSGISELAIGRYWWRRWKDVLVQTTNALSIVNRLGTMVDVSNSSAYRSWIYRHTAHLGF